MKRLLTVALALFVVGGVLVGCAAEPTTGGEPKPPADKNAPAPSAGLPAKDDGDKKPAAPSAAAPNPAPAPGGGGGGGDGVPSFSLAWSEYPSWSVFGVASDIGLIDGAKGKMGTLEKKWNVDIELKLLSYDACVSEYAAKTADASCLTNMDTLSSSLGRKSVSIMPTSTSVGADALLVVGVKDIQDLKNKKIEVQGLAESVSQYTFARVLEKKFKMDDADFKYVNTDPEKAALAMQAKKAQAIVVWNPFVLQTEKHSKDVKRLFDSSEIPEEIVDMVIVGQDVLRKEGGDRFACCIVETFYKFSEQLEDKSKRDDLLVALGKKFSSLNKDEMAVACTATRFYKTPDEALGLFEGKKFPETMEMIVKFWHDRKWIKGKPEIGFGDFNKAKSADFRIDPTYIKMVKDKK